jgi:hypothetical protein
MFDWWENDKLRWRFLATAIVLGVAAGGFFAFFVTYTGNEVNGFPRGILAFIYLILFMAKLAALGWTLWMAYNDRNVEDAKPLHRLPHVIVLTGAVVIVGAQGGALLST